MTDLVLPDPKDVPTIVVDYLDLLMPQEKNATNREHVIGICETLFSLIIRTCELAQMHGETEQLMCTAFMRDIVMPQWALDHLQTVRAKQAS